MFCFMKSNAVVVNPLGFLYWSGYRFGCRDPKWQWLEHEDALRTPTHTRESQRVGRLYKAINNSDSSLSAWSGSFMYHFCSHLISQNRAYICTELQEMLENVAFIYNKGCSPCFLIKILLLVKKGKQILGNIIFAAFPCLAATGSLLTQMFQFTILSSAPPFSSVAHPFG